VPDKVLKGLVRILLPHCQTDGFDDIANHLEEFWTFWKELVDVKGGCIAHISKCIIDFPFV
jgi:hypothetical protein